ncbi:MAG: DUF2797 domain-containing protein [Crenarchaeota archaeon]|nr:DUF2797 domain-containing protein [Thermoproteota archaeon]
MAKPLVIRGVLPTLRPAGYGLREYRVSLIGSSGRILLQHNLFRVEGFRLLVQPDPLSPGVELVDGDGFLVSSLGKRMCRFHEGRGGRLLSWRFCTRPAVTVSGFCMDHRSSPQALYEKCNAGRLDACLVVDTAWRGESYSVYLLDYGSKNVKVGLTRTWRLPYRIAEQPHLAALELGRYGSLYEARMAERRIGRSRGFTEGIGVDRVGRLERVVESLEKKGVGVAEEAARRLAEAVYRATGRGGRRNCVTILPGVEPSEFTRARRVREPEPPLRLLGYWAGVFLAESRGERIVFEADQLLHRVVYT